MGGHGCPLRQIQDYPWREALPYPSAGVIIHSTLQEPTRTEDVRYDLGLNIFKSIGFHSCGKTSKAEQAELCRVSWKRRWGPASVGVGLGSLNPSVGSGSPLKVCVIKTHWPVLYFE